MEIATTKFSKPLRKKANKEHINKSDRMHYVLQLH